MLQEKYIKKQKTELKTFTPKKKQKYINIKGILNYTSK